ncbi:putative lipid II flippase FtsW [Rhodococcus aerolatus]
MASTATRRPTPDPTRRPSRRPSRRRPRTAARAVHGWLDRPFTSLHLVLGTGALLTVFGLVMQLSASDITSYLADGSAYALFDKQALFTVVGVVALLVTVRVPVRALRRWSGPALAVCLVLLVLVLVPGLGHVAHGASKWFDLGPVAFQPAEPAKVALAVWGAHVLSRPRDPAAPLRSLLLPLVPVGVLVLALVVAQPDLGTAISLGVVLLALLFFAGAPLLLFAGALGTAVAGVAVLAVTAGYRASRVTSFLDPAADPQGAGYQALQARDALADGGLLGAGLGEGAAKWSYLPNAQNDFIFAIVGEELGLLGALVLLALLATLAWAGLRVAARSADPFLALLTSTLTVWLLAQALINIGYVVGLLPVTGVTLPLVSAGGTSSAVTLVVIGLLASAARAEPAARASLLAHGPDRVSRLLRLGVPAAARHPVAPRRGLTGDRDGVRLTGSGRRGAGQPVARRPPRRR